MRDTQSYLFPASQLGLALYMFVVGMEFRIDIVRRKLTSSIAVSVAGMLTPFVLGAGLQRGIISEGLFATLVIMAVLTTLMASPLFERLVGSGTHQSVPEPEAEEAGEPKFGR